MASFSSPPKANAHEDELAFLPQNGENPHGEFKDSIPDLGFVEQRNEDKENSRNVENMWTPLALKRRAMAAFALIFLLTIIGLEIVYNVSKLNGFGPTSSNMHYVWTYGPTACEYKNAENVSIADQW
jgi:hypothetical protein